MPGNFEDLKRAFKAREAQLLPAWTEGTKQATNTLFRASKKRLQAGVYSKPPDRRKKHEGTKLAKGRKGGKEFQWTQTGQLGRSERKQLLGPYTGVIDNRARTKSGGYAHARHNLGLTGGDPRVIPPAPRKKRDTNRIAPWRSEAIDETREARLEAYRKALLDALQRTRVS